MAAMEDVLLYTATKPQSQADIASQLQVTKTTRDPIVLTSLRIPCSKETCDEMGRYQLKLDSWRRAKDLQTIVLLGDFVDALAVFVRQRRNRLDGVTPEAHLLDRREPDPAWVEEYFVSLHSSITCWERDGKGGEAIDKLAERHARCSPAWRGIEGNWRRDCVWVQEHLRDSNSQYVESRPDVVGGRLLGRLQLIVTVLDPTRQNTKEKPLRYTGALVELFKWRNKGRIHETHGMFEVEKWPANTSVKPRDLGPLRFYDIPTILHCAHLIPANPAQSFFYVNNWVNWEAYNTIYDPDFEEKNLSAAKKWAKRL